MAGLEFMSSQPKFAGAGAGDKKASEGGSLGVSACILSMAGRVTGMQAQVAGITREASHLLSTCQ